MASNPTLAADPRDPVNVGVMVAGKYLVDAILGRGAMGVVVRATHVQLEATVAIKFLLSKSKGEAERRFMREARIAAKLKSQHAGKVVDVGVHGGAPFLVMEYLEGEDLAALLAREGPLRIEDAVVYVLQACEALAEAHSLGITHRDVKPANLMLTKSAGGAPCIKVLDFGVSKAVGALGAAGTEEARLTGTTQMLGSPLYMAPEQVTDAATADGRSDVWSIGIVLYELLTGTTPWTGTSILALLSNMVKNPPTPIASLRPDLPAGLGAVIAQCIEQDRSRRWRNVADFAAALALYGPEPAELVVQRIASSHRLPAPEIARPTEPMPAPGEVSAFGWSGVEEAPALADSAERRPLASSPDTAPVAVPARTSVASTSSVAGHGARTRRIALGIPIVAAAVIAILLLRSVLTGPRAGAEPIAIPAQTQEKVAPAPPEPTVQAAATVAQVTVPTAPPTPATSPTPTSRSQPPLRTVPPKSPSVRPPPAASLGEPPGGSRR